jgi:TolB-like protein/class 3 adenylate cyclase/Flp pilus assembly protein TadD
LATERVERKLAAILAADVAGYSRLMGADEEGTHERLKAHFRQLIDPKIKEHRGRIVKNTGDGMLAEFSSVVDAVRCAAEIQHGMIDRNAEVPEDKRITFRIGVNLGDVIVEPEDIFGDGVNIAARLEALAEPGGICISRTVRDHIGERLPYLFEDMGEQSVKNIARPVRAYVMSAAAVALLPPDPSPEEASKPAIASNAPRLSIVVLPFANLSNDPEQEYFADGITDDLITDLSRISGSFVIARNTAFTYKGKPVDLRHVSRELGVRYILEGSIRRTGDQVRLNVQLIDGDTGAHLWADRFQTDRANLAQAQDDITGRLTQTLNLEMVEAAVSRIEQEGVVDPDARDLVMRGWACWYRPRSATNQQDAQRAFERALEIDPRSVDARIGIASVLAANLSDARSCSVQQDEARAEQSLLEALERDANRSTAHRALGHLRRSQNRLTESRIELETATALDRNDARAFFQLSMTLMYMGEPEAAISQLEKAMRLNPRDPNVAQYYWGLGACHLLLSHVKEAIDLLRRACAANPWHHYPPLHLAAALGLKGNLDEARSALAKSIKLQPDVNSLARWRASRPYLNNPQYQVLLERTFSVGLRQAGFPDE